MRLKYDTVTGEVLAMGEMPNLEGGVDVDFPIPSEPLNYFTFNGTELVRKEQSVIDGIKARINFNLVMFQGDLANALPSLSSPNLRWEFAALNTYATNKDFEGLAGYLGQLVALGAATQDDIDSVIFLLTKQGIVL
jgi:hypothetical protein